MRSSSTSSSLSCQSNSHSNSHSTRSHSNSNSNCWHSNECGASGVSGISATSVTSIRFLSISFLNYYYVQCENIEKNNNEQSSSTHSWTAIVRVETPPSSYNGSVGGLAKPNAQNFQERIEKAGLIKQWMMNKY